MISTTNVRMKFIRNFHNYLFGWVAIVGFMIGPIHNVQAQYWFYKTYGGNGTDRGFAVDKAYNGDYFVAGLTNTSGAGNFDYFVMRLDPNGKIVWSKTYGSTGVEEGYPLDIICTSDSAVLMCGSTKGYNAWYRDAFIMKLDFNGTVLWEKRVGGSGNDHGKELAEYSNGDYLLTGSGTGNGSDDGSVCRLSSNGTVIYRYSYGSVANDQIVSSTPTKDNGVVFTGRTLGYGLGNSTCILGKTDSIGTIKWLKTIDGSSGFESGSKVQNTLDGGYIFTGHTQGFGAGGYDCILSKHDSVGNLQWYKTYGSAQDDYGRSVTVLPDSTYLITGSTNSFSGNGNKDVFIIKTDKTGNIVWQNFYGDAARQEITWQQRPFIDQGNDEIVVCAETDSSGQGTEMLLLKVPFSSNGVIGCKSKIANLSMSPHSPPVTNITLGTVSSPATATTTSIVNVYNAYEHVSCQLLGCFDSAAFDIPVIYPICTRDSVVIINKSMGGGPYKWFDNGVQFSTLANPKWATTVIGNHSIRLIAGTGVCADTMDMFVNISPGVKADAGGPLQICVGDSIQLGGSPTGQGGTGTLSYRWSPGGLMSDTISSNPWVVPSTSTSFYVVVTDSIGCVGLDTTLITVNPLPLANAGNDDTICFGDTTVLGGSPTASGGNGPYKYSWTPNYNMSIDTIANPSAWPGSDTVYYVQVTDQNGCKNMDSIMISVNSLPVIDTSLLSVVNAKCDSINGSISGIQSSGSPPLTYSWNYHGFSIDTSLNLNGLDSGSYYLTVSDNNGCSAELGPIIIYQLGKPNADAGGPYIVCSGDSIKIGGVPTGSGGTGRLTYKWVPWGSLSSDTAANPVVNPNGPAQYTVVVTDSLGCKNWDTASISFYPTQFLSGAFFIEQGDKVQLQASGGTSYHWFPSEGLSCTSCPNPLASPLDTTVYCVAVTHPSSCLDTTCVTIYVDLTCEDFYIPTAFSPNGDGSNDAYCIFGQCIETMHLMIYDRWGEQVFETTDKDFCWDGTYRGKVLNSSVFTYYFTSTFYNGQEIERKGNISLVR